MNKNNNTTEPAAGRIRSSITSKLGTRLFFRLLGLLMTLNIIIIIISGCALAVYCEYKTVNVLSKLDSTVATGDFADFTRWSAVSGVGFRVINAPSISGSDIDAPLRRIMPYAARITARGFRADMRGFPETVRSITYVVNAESGDVLVEVTLQIGTFILFFIFAFGALFAFELLTLISRPFKDRRIVRRTLDPITEFARAASSLSAASRRLEHEKVMALAGRLDGIDISRLDTRIQVDDLQEELRNVAVAINGMLDRINESYAQQARFVSDASHELRTPISVIQGYANLLDRWGKEDEKTLTESISAIRDEAGNMKELVEQLLFLARGDSNTIRLEEERIHLAELIEEVSGEMRMVTPGREFKVKSENLTVTADRSLIKQALRILVDNAVKYTDEGGEITISAAGDGEYIKISVSDDGVGISPEILSRVFDRFVRADESRARKTGGAGLGLSIAQWIAARHNGHMEVLSREGIGTRMTLAIPTAKTEASVQTTVVDESRVVL